MPTLSLVPPRNPAPAGRSLGRDRRGTVAAMMAVSLIPLFIAIGVGVDMSRLATAKSTLQQMADEAALAGAAAYQTTGQQTSAQNVAVAYFNKAVALQSGLVTGAVLTASGAPGNYSASVPSNNMAVSVTASMPTMFMSLANINSIAITAKATAANPWVAPTGTGTQAQWQPVISSGFLGSSAGDWNSVYMYAVPLVNGTPNWSYLPPIANLYEVASNCSAATNVNWTSNSQCNASVKPFFTGQVVSTSQSIPPVASNQPLAFVFFNMTHGMSPVSANSGYANQYGSQGGDMRLHVTVGFPLGMGPAGLDDSPDNYVNDMFNSTGSKTAYKSTGTSTTYSSVNQSATPNCAVEVQVIDPANPPALPPVQYKCFSLTDPAAGSQYMNLTCAQMNGRTFVYWFNDMGGNPDDKDYNDLWFAIKCVPAPAPSNGGYLYSGTQTASPTTVALIK